MTVIRHNSISGIVSITAATGSNLAFYDSTGSTLSLDTGDINAGVITATTANFTNATISGDLTVNGTTTTLDTTVTEVDRLEVGANNSTVGVAITQSGSGDILRLYDGATQVVTVKDGGSVGIGTDNPARLLQVYNASSNPQINIKSATGGTCELQFGDNADEVRGNIVYNCTDDYLSLHGYNNAERLRITSSGNVGLSVTSPDLRLHVNGINALPSSSGSTPTGYLTLRNKQGGSSHGMFMGVSNVSPWCSWIQAQDANNNATNYPLLLNPNGGNVGIGTDNPDGKLAVTGNGYNQINIASTNAANTNKLGGVTSQNYVGDKWSIIQTYSPSGSNQIYYGSADGGYRGATTHYFYVNSDPNATTGHTEALRINSNGIEVGSYTNSGNTVLFKTDNNNTTRINFYDENNTEGCYLKAEGITNGGIFRMGNRWNTDSDKISFNMVDGTIGVPNGGGLSFAATSDASGKTSELLDDYEEGTWTPTIVQGVTSPTYTNTGGSYTKIGNCVLFTFRMQCTGGTEVGSQLRIGGLPYSSGGTAQRQGGASWNYSDNIGNSITVEMHIPTNSTQIYFYHSNGGTWNGNAGNGVVSEVMHVHGQYFV